MVARLTPDQKVACSIHVGFKTPDPWSLTIFLSSISTFPTFFSTFFYAFPPFLPFVLLLLRFPPLILYLLLAPMFSPLKPARLPPKVSHGMEVSLSEREYRGYTFSKVMLGKRYKQSRCQIPCFHVLLLSKFSLLYI